MRLSGSRRPYRESNPACALEKRVSLPIDDRDKGRTFDRWSDSYPTSATLFTRRYSRYFAESATFSTGAFTLQPHRLHRT